MSKYFKSKGFAWQKKYANPWQVNTNLETELSLLNCSVPQNKSGSYLPYKFSFKYFSFFFLLSLCVLFEAMKKIPHTYTCMQTQTHTFTHWEERQALTFFNRWWKILTQAEVQGSPNYNLKVIKVLLMPNGILKVTLKVYDRTLHLTVVREWQDRSIFNCKRP